MSWKPQASDNDTAREPRVSKLVSLEVSSERHDRTKIVVRNMSPHGLGARADIDLLPCERVIVHLPDGGNVGATVRWVKKGTFGLALDDRIDASSVRPKVKANGALLTRDADQGFRLMRHDAVTSRSGFQRSHRDEVLRNSNWMNDLS